MQALEAAVHAANAVSDSYAGARARVLAEIVASYARAAPARARALLEMMQGDWSLKANGYADIAGGMAACHSVPETLAYCESLLDSYDRSHAYAAVARTLTAKGDTAGALMAAQQVDEPLLRPALLIEIAKHLAAEKKTTDALALLIEADRLCTATWQGNPACVLADSAVVEAGIEHDEKRMQVKIDLAMRRAQEIPIYRQALCFAKLAVALTESGSPGRGAGLARNAVAAASSVVEPDLAVDVLLEVAELLSSAQITISLGALRQVRQLISRLSARHLRAMKSIRTAKVLHQLGQTSTADEVLRQAVQDMEAFGAAHWQAAGLASLALSLIDLQRPEWARSLVDRAIKLGTEAIETDTQIEYIRRLGLDTQKSDISTAIMEPQTREEHWHVRALTNLAIAISRTGNLDTAVAVMQRTLKPLADHWIDAGALRHAIDGLIYVLQPKRVQNRAIAQSAPLLDLAAHMIDQARGREKAETTCILYASLAVTRALRQELVELEPLISPVASDLDKVDFGKINTNDLAAILYQVAFAATMAGNSLILEKLRRHAHKIDEVSIRSQLTSQLDWCESWVRTTGSTPRAVQRFPAASGKTPTSSVEGKLAGSVGEGVLYPPNHVEIGKFPSRKPRFSPQDQRRYGRLIKLLDRLRAACSAKSPLSAKHFQDMITSELHGILVHDERNERTYELNALIDETLDVGERLHVDLLPVAVEALQKAADLSRVDLWCTLGAVMPVIEKAGAAVALWNSMQATARWWDIQWLSEEGTRKG